MCDCRAVQPCRMRAMRTFSKVNVATSNLNLAASASSASLTACSAAAIIAFRLELMVIQSNHLFVVSRLTLIALIFPPEFLLANLTVACLLTHS